jgi:transposase InsO family protein
MKVLANQYRVADLCAAFAVSRSGYHAWRTRSPGPRQRADVELSEHLCRVHAESRQTYGSPRLLQALLQQGHRTSRRRVRRLMRQHDLHTQRPRRFVPQTTDSRHDQPVAPNHLAARPSPTGPDQQWVTDITYVRTSESWLYVAAVMDRWSRRIVGLAMAEHMESTLVKRALQQALGQRRPARGCLHHSDRGSQYASADYRQLLTTNGLTASMSRAGNCYDNAAMESFWGKLKTELVYRQHFATRQQARLAIFEYVEVFYNRVRLHSALGFKSPVDFEQQLN